MAWLTSLAKLFSHQALPESQLIVNGSQFYHDHPTRVNFGHEALFVYSKVFVLKEISNLCLWRRETNLEETKQFCIHTVLGEIPIDAMIKTPLRLFYFSMSNQKQAQKNLKFNAKNSILRTYLWRDSTNVSDWLNQAKILYQATANQIHYSLHYMDYCRLHHQKTNFWDWHLRRVLSGWIIQASLIKLNMMATVTRSKF